MYHIKLIGNLMLVLLYNYIKTQTHSIKHTTTAGRGGAATKTNRTTKESDDMEAFMRGMGGNQSYLSDVMQKPKELDISNRNQPSRPSSRNRKQWNEPSSNIQSKESNYKKDRPQSNDDDGMAAFLGGLGGNPSYLDDVMQKPNKSKSCTREADDDMAAFMRGMGGNQDYLTDVLG